MVPGRASSASLSLRNAADSAGESIICVNFPLKRSRWYLDECETLLDKWCFALKHISTLDKLPL